MSDLANAAAGRELSYAQAIQEAIAIGQDFDGDARVVCSWS